MLTQAEVSAGFASSMPNRLVILPGETPIPRVTVTSAHTIHAERGKLIEQGVHELPCEIDLRISEVLARVARKKFAFDFFFEPLDGVTPRLDVLLLPLQGRSSEEKLLEKVEPGVTRTVTVRRLGREKLLLRSRCSVDSGDRGASVRVWLRDCEVS